MKTVIRNLLSTAISELGVNDFEPQVDISSHGSFGEYTTNAAMQLLKNKGFRSQNPDLKSPYLVALQVVKSLNAAIKSAKAKDSHHNTHKIDQIVLRESSGKDELQDIDHVEVVKPGFINFFLTEAKLSRLMMEVLKTKQLFGTSQNKSGKKYMVEFAHPNTHKAFHIGHLRNITTGECIVRLLQSQNHQIIRSNYQGDVGLHIAKCMYALLEVPEYSSRLDEVRSAGIREKVDFLGKVYAAGSQAYENNPEAKDSIHDYNYLIYAAAARFARERGLPEISTDYISFVVKKRDQLSQVYGLWKETRQWSLDYYDGIYKRVNSHFDRLYFESECLGGVDIARTAVKKGVLEESEGAIIFNGQPYGLDTRVFVNRLGLPTYEGKELALSQQEFSEFGRIDKAIHVVGPEQASFFQVTFKVEELLNPEMKGKQYHLIYGWVRLKHGKMSSRLGNVLTGEWLIDEVKNEISTHLHSNSSKGDVIDQNTSSDQAEKSDSELAEISEKTAIAAIKYAFLKVGTNSDIAFDIKESINVNGDSGVYLLYTYARCQSVLRKAKDNGIDKYENSSDDPNITHGSDGLNPEERAISRLLIFFPEIVAEASVRFAPNLICTYLFNLAQVFNQFYQKNQIIQPEQPTTSRKRLQLTAAVSQIMSNGLYLLGIETLEKI